MAGPDTPSPVIRAASTPSSDERVRDIGAWRRFLSRPEFGSISGAVLVFVLFGLVAGDSGMFSAEGIVNWATVAAFLGIIAVGAALLDDRRRVRPVDRLDDRLRRHDARDPRAVLGLAAVGRRSLHVRTVRRCSAC